jgi:hypothetical protein
LLADEALVTEHEASTLVHMRRGRLLALRTDQGEMSCAPTLSEMSKPVHVFPLARHASPCRLESPEHNRSARKSGNVSRLPMCCERRRPAQCAQKSSRRLVAALAWPHRSARHGTTDSPPIQPAFSVVLLP